jgi:very-short-patch-repair endonuclease
MIERTDQNTSNDEIIRANAIRIFTYLKELAQLRTKVVRDCKEYEDLMWFNDIPKEQGCYSIAWGSKAEEYDDIWVEIRKMKEPPCPRPPSICTDWIVPAELLNIDQPPTVKEKIPKQDPNGNLVYLHLNDNPEVEKAWRKYFKESWQPWVETHKRWESVQAIYGKLFNIYQQQKRLGEAYELLLGLGLLVWITKSGQRVRRHILVSQANILFDANKGIIRVGPSADGSKLILEVDMLEPSERPVPDLERDFEKILGEVSEMPWDRTLVEPIIRGFVNAIDERGLYEGSLEPAKDFKQAAYASYAPALILRKRTSRNLVTSFNNILQQLKKNNRVPFNIRRICQITDDSDRSKALENAQSQEDNFEEILFPLPSNEEQLEIAKRLSSHRSLLVQGPPGTGKSHTIANLICNLLAYGNRVLVTSQTPRALRVLAQKIPKEVSALCVSVLGNDIASLNNLEASAQQITETLTHWSDQESKSVINRLEGELYKLKKRKAEVEVKLRELREIETYKFSVAGGAYSGTAQTIAKRLAEESSEHAWFLDKIDDKVLIPFDSDSFQKLLKAYRDLPKVKVEELSRPMVKVEDLPTVDRLLSLINLEQELYVILKKYGAIKSEAICSILMNAEKSDRENLKQTLNDLSMFLEKLRTEESAWVSQSINEMLSGRAQFWRNLYDHTKKHLEDISNKVKKVESLSVSLPEDKRHDQMLADSEDLLSHLNSGGGLGWWIFRKDVVKRTIYLTKNVRINGHPCKGRLLLSSLRDYLSVNRVLEILWNSWNKLINRVKDTQARQISELSVSLEVLANALKITGYLNQAKESVKRIKGLPEPPWHNEGAIGNMIEVLRGVEAQIAYDGIEAAIADIQKLLKLKMVEPNSHPINRDILNALNNRDIGAYAGALDKLKQLGEQRSQLNERNRLHSQLKSVAPKLTKILAETAVDPVWDKRIERIETAWQWAQADAWLSGFFEEHQLPKLETELDSLESSMRKATAELAAAKAWRHCFERITEDQRVHLMAYVKAIKKIGKGTGRHAAKHRRDAQSNLEKCRGVIPAWVMPFYRAVETISPSPEMFDVVIIDEASQSGPESILLFYLAKKCIIVGDDQQISPDAVGIDQDDVNLLISRHLLDVPVPESFDVNSSLFSQGEIRFGNRIILREHFRCMPEIIRFSNELCYPHTPLVPLRQYPPERLEPIVTVPVANGFREGGAAAINRPEAETVAEAIQECCKKRSYAGRSMGVISLQGEAQARLIGKLLMDKIGAEEIERRALICGDAYDFQGDERDIIFLSMVAAPNERIGALVKESDKRRFNVAVSRARDQVWVFYSATLNDLNPECMRYKLLSYCIEHKPIETPVDETVFESQFEHDVYTSIKARGFKVIPQYRVANYKIDLVVEGLKSRLAVECDGDEWHGPEVFEKDMYRQRILERCGWIFFRISGGEYYRNPEKVLEKLWPKLEGLEIKPFRHHESK